MYSYLSTQLNTKQLSLIHSGQLYQILFLHLECTSDFIHLFTFQQESLQDVLQTRNKKILVV